jgi:hypothetical protein|tara:strand:+ start:359 stop:610 length:252 start_codon:yes stop_codon:yes gene_type:complete
MKSSSYQNAIRKPNSAPDSVIDGKCSGYSIFESLLWSETAASRLAADWRLKFRAVPDVALAEIYTLLAKVCSVHLRFSSFLDF